MFITKLFSASIAGIYNYTNRILLTPIRFFASSYSQVMYQKLAEQRLKNETYYFSLIAKSTNQIFYYLSIPFALFVYTSVYYIPVVFGENWLDLYKFMYILAPYSFLVLMSAAFTNVFQIDNKQDIGLILKIVFVVFRIGAIILGASLNWDILFTLTLFSMGSVISLLSNYFVYYRVSRKALPFSIYLFILVSIAVYSGIFIVLI